MVKEHHKALKLLLLATVFFTGFSALVYEAVWQRYLVNLLGSESRATSIILSVYLGGLSVGYLLFGELTKKISPHIALRVCGVAEICIGIWASLVPTLFGFIQNAEIFSSMAATFGLAGDIAVAVSVMAIPTILMGGTIPLLVSQAIRGKTSVAKWLSEIYCINIAGGFVGVIAAGFWIIPHYGLYKSSVSIAWLNLFAGILFCILSYMQKCETRSLGPVHQELDLFISKESTKLKLCSATSLAFISGYYSIALEVLAIRLAGQSFGSSEYSFSMVVGAYIVLLAIGSAMSQSRPFSRLTLTANQVAIVFGMLILYMSVWLWPYIGHLLRLSFSNEPHAFYFYHVALFCGVATALAPSVIPIGVTLPLLVKYACPEAKDAGSATGKIYACNTVGCIVGALSAGYLLLYIVDLDAILKLAILLALLTTVLACKSKAESCFIFSLGVAIALLIDSGCLPDWNQSVRAIGNFRVRKSLPSTYSGPTSFYSEFLGSRRVVAYKDDPNTSVAVVEKGSGISLQRSIWVNGKSDGLTSGDDLRTTKLLAHIPMIFVTREAQKVAIVGFGTGITAGSARLYPGLRTIEVFEIAPFVKNFAPFFDFANYGVSKDPRVIWNLNDAYRALSYSDSKYEVIISEPSNPWVAGIDKLYSIEFYNQVQKSLEPGGIYSQWFHAYSMSELTLRTVVATFAASFKSSRIFQIGSDLILIGSELPLNTLSIEKAIQRFNVQEVRLDLQSVGIGRLSDVTVHELWLNESFSVAPSTGLHSLAEPKLSYFAGKDFFRAKSVNVKAVFDAKSDRSRTLKIWSAQLSTMLQDIEKNGLKDFVATLCNSSIESATQSWAALSWRCQAGLVALAVISGSKVNVPLSRRELRVLMELWGSQSAYFPAGDAVSDRDACLALELYEKYESPLMPISRERVLEYSASCKR